MRVLFVGEGAGHGRQRRAVGYELAERHWANGETVVARTETDEFVLVGVAAAVAAGNAQLLAAGDAPMAFG